MQARSYCADVLDRGGRLPFAGDGASAAGGVVLGFYGGLRCRCGVLSSSALLACSVGAVDSTECICSVGAADANKRRHRVALVSKSLDCAHK